MPTPLSDIELLARLVAFDTTSRRPNRPLDDFVCDYLDGRSVRVERFDAPDSGENVLLSAGPPCERGEGLLLCAHVDTVPADEPEWSSDPRSLVVRDDRLVARGACDMKGFVALAVNLLHACGGCSLREPLQLLLTCNEEIGTQGAAAFARAWPKGRPLPRRCLVGEPTSMRLVRGHKGHLSLTIACHGVAAHSGFPQKGVNAIERAASVISALGVLRKAYVAERNAESVLFPEVPFPVLTTARIRGGSAINVIPERCEIDVGIRLLPGMPSAVAVERVREAVEAVVPTGGVEVRVTNDTPAFATSKDAPLYGELASILGQTEEFGVGFGTDAGRLAQLGVECVVWGPGDISQAHRPDEWMPRDEFARAAAILPTLVR
ncbi:MAG: acetylornithine deacetylase [Phycisphaerae bacterium]|nr:acetylornithine deacetylase [Phycisphaerae bacterium]